MATKEGIASISGIFVSAYDKPISEYSYSIWLDTFKDVSNDDLRHAAHLLVKKRDKTRSVVPGEITAKLEALDICVGREKNSEGFASSPVVKALKSRHRAEEEAAGVTLHEWLAQEGLKDWKEATEKFADEHYTSTAVPCYG